MNTLLSSNVQHRKKRGFVVICVRAAMTARRTMDTLLQVIHAFTGAPGTVSKHTGTFVPIRQTFHIEFFAFPRSPRNIEKPYTPSTYLALVPRYTEYESYIHSFISLCTRNQYVVNVLAARSLNRCVERLRRNSRFTDKGRLCWHI
jgi:hypothetical protein